jgi:DNA-binding NarL/FixJ family response regulator
VIKRRILIVDDQIVVAKELEGRLTRLGYEVAGIASSEDEAIAMIAEATPDLGVDGHEAPGTREHRGC